jgi:hypothetical protein
MHKPKRQVWVGRCRSKQVLARLGWTLSRWHAPRKCSQCAAAKVDRSCDAARPRIGGACAVGGACHEHAATSHTRSRSTCKTPVKLRPPSAGGCVPLSRMPRCNVRYLMHAGKGLEAGAPSHMHMHLRNSTLPVLGAAVHSLILWPRRDCYNISLLAVASRACPCRARPYSALPVLGTAVHLLILLPRRDCCNISLLAVACPAGEHAARSAVSRAHSRTAARLSGMAEHMAAGHDQAAWRVAGCSVARPVRFAGSCSDLLETWLWVTPGSTERVASSLRVCRSIRTLRRPYPPFPSCTSPGPSTRCPPPLAQTHIRDGCLRLGIPGAPSLRKG